MNSLKRPEKEHRRKIINLNKFSYLFPFILLTIFLLRLPAIVILPMFFNRTTHTFANFIIFLIFIKVLLDPRIKDLIKPNKILFSFLGLNLLALSLSSINVLNINSFLQTFKNFLIGYMLFIIILFYFRRNDINKITTILIFSTAVNLFIQIIIYFSPTFFFNFLNEFIHPKGAAFIEYQISRSRFFGDTFDEVFTPIILFLSLKSRQVKQVFFYLLLLLAIIFITVVSNWRTKQLMFFFAFFSSTIYFLIIKIKVNKIRSFFLLSVIMTIFFLSNTLSVQLVGQSSITRLLNPGKLERNSTQSRFKMWMEAIEIGKSHPVLGVGLGNYYDYWRSWEKIQIWLSSLETRNIILIDHPHNIFVSFFAETGFFGLLTYIILLSYFFFCDIRSLTQKKPLVGTLIFSFWSLFLFSLFNPSNGLNYLSLFWILRAMIYIFSLSYIE